MVHSMQSLYAYGHAFDIALIAAGAAAALAAILCVCSCVLPGRCGRWRQRRAERRYVRTGMRELEQFLSRSRPSRTPGPHGG
jgi:hypothetical protein